MSETEENISKNVENFAATDYFRNFAAKKGENMQNDIDIEQRLRLKGVKPTANRILVLQELIRFSAPANLSDLEKRLLNMDKSSIFRTMTLFLEHDVVHAFQDGRGTLSYELCESETECHHNDSHIHFFCEKCQQTYCLDKVNFKDFHMPEDFLPLSASFVIKGICSACRENEQVKKR